MVEIDCDWCGTTFNKKPSLIEKSDNDFCSTECYGEWNSAHRSGEDHPQFDSVEVECGNCGETKYINRSRYEDQDNFYCDAKCQTEHQDLTGESNPCWRGGSAKIECAGCRELFEVPPYRSETARFCSLKCKGKYRRESGQWAGKNHPMYKGYSGNYGSEWPKMRDKIRERDENTCQRCGEEGGDDWLPVHHIRPVREFTDPNDAHTMENMVQLCRPCHGVVERTFSISEQKQLFQIEKEENFNWIQPTLDTFS